MKPHVSTKKGKSSIAKYLENIVAELKKVVWPTKQEAINLSLLVVIVSITMGIVLGLLDYGFTQLIEKVFFGR